MYSIIPIKDSLGDHKIDKKLFTQILVLKKLYPNRILWIKEFAVPFILLIFKYRMFYETSNIGLNKNWIKELF